MAERIATWSDVMAFEATRAPHTHRIETLDLDEGLRSCIVYRDRAADDAVIVAFYVLDPLETAAGAGLLASVGGMLG